MSFYLDFVQDTKNYPHRKTKVFDVFSQRQEGVRLGVIEWNNGWRRYWFYVDEGGVGFDADCLDEINVFLMRLMNERKIAVLTGEKNNG